MSDTETRESLHIFLTGNANCDKFFLMKMPFQSLSKIFSHESV